MESAGRGPRSSRGSASGSSGRAVCVFVALAGCYQWPSVTPDPLGTSAPAITSTTITCVEEDAEWTFTVETDAWTGNGALYLSADGEYIEQHALPSVSAPSDGSADKLERTLDVVATWRDVEANNSTAFGCASPDLAGIITVSSRSGAEVTDCLAFGVEPARWSNWDAGVTCDAVRDTGDTGDADSGG